MSGSRKEIISRADRRAWLDEQLEERKKQRERQHEQQSAASKLEEQEFWAPFAHQAETTGELNIAWKQASSCFTWQRVLGFQNLVALRITGHQLQEIPEPLAFTLSSLETLSLIDDKLERLPANIGTLVHLTNLDLTKNRLKQLPASLTQLSALKVLNLSNNRLEDLPTTFGSLENLEKLWLECNQLQTLPESFGACQRLRYANLTNNKLITLPESMGDLESLVTLSVNLNALVELPDTLIKLANLQTFHASRNQLVKLPRNIGHMQSLRELRLDWNAIQELPFSFQALSQLQLLSLEQNPMRMPPRDIIARGISESIKYMEKAFEAFQRSGRREIVEALQEVFAFATQLVMEFEASNSKREGEFDNNTRVEDVHVIMSLFEPHCDHLAPLANHALRVYGVVWERFYSDLLPAIERQQARRQDANANGTHVPFSHRFTPTEIEDSLMHYHDDFGIVSVTGEPSSRVLVEFRQCACVALPESGKGLRKACLPRQSPFRCQRFGRLLRAQMLTREQAQDQVASSYFRVKVARLELKTQRRAIEYVESTAGGAAMDQIARGLALAMGRRHRRLRTLVHESEKKLRQVTCRRDKLRVQVATFRRTKVSRVQLIREKCTRIEKEREALEKEIAMGSGKEKEVARKRNTLKKLDEKWIKLQNEVEKEDGDDGEVEKLELAIAKLEREEHELSSRIEKAFEWDLDVEVEDQDQGEDSKEDDSDDDEDGSESEQEESVEEVVSRVSTRALPPVSSSPFFNIETPSVKIEDYRQSAVKLVLQELTKRASDKNGKPMAKSMVVAPPSPFAIPLDVAEDVLVNLFRTHLRTAYVAMQCARVAHQVTREVVQLRYVLQRWRGRTTRAVLQTWHDVAHSSRNDALAEQRRKKRIEGLKKQNLVLEEEVARKEARRWVQATDMYTDRIYYENQETGETALTPPPYWALEMASC